MKFKVGETWRTKGGWKATVVEDDKSDFAPFRVHHEPHPNGLKLGGPLWHHENGEAYAVMPNKWSCALVECVQEPKEDPSTWKAGDILECVSDKEADGREYANEPHIGSQYVFEAFTGGWVRAQGKWGGHSKSDAAQPHNFKLVSKAAERIPIQSGDRFYNPALKKELRAFQFDAKKFVLALEGSYNRYMDNIFQYRDEVLNLGYLAELGLKIGDRVTMSNDEHGTVINEYRENAYRDAEFRVEVSDGYYCVNRFGCSLLSEARIISVNDGPEFLPIGTYIKFVRDSRSGRYYKGELARVVDHGKKSMCVHKVGSAEGIFLPPDRGDIYEVVKV